VVEALRPLEEALANSHKCHDYDIEGWGQLEQAVEAALAAVKGVDRG
jgi:hypothetical protein